ncbi:MAG: type II secretion system major pseudopilin GspG [Desulfurivibrionaceae bacterium]|nr:type II secretion system major pseudopilin GspG [Desulfobulbales bacterium]MDT8334465.1 type II secretion system major pseudopilin GspG [Desulfurivibrionaceae bacterium]
MQKPRLLRDSRGFSLIEIMVVMIIIGLLAGLVGPKLFGQLGKAKQKTAKAQIEMIMAALDAYRLDVGSYPSQQEGLEALISNPGAGDWAGPYLAKPQIPVDPWDHTYLYRNPGQNSDIEVISLGQDNKEGGTGEDADIRSWE